MDGTSFASLAQIRILLLPVGPIRRSVFEKYAGLIRSLENIRLGDILLDQHEDKNRFLPSPLSTGSLHMSFTTHPPPAWQNTFSLFRVSSFPLGVIGIADCSQPDALATAASEFKATLASIFAPASAAPFSTKCFAFGEGESILNVENVDVSELVMIPSLMSNKQVYISTLLAEMCHDILAEFPALVRAVDSVEGLDSLTTNLLPGVCKGSIPGAYTVTGPYLMSNGHSAPSRSSLVQDLSLTARSSTPVNGLPPSTSASRLGITMSKKRASTTPGTSNGRLAKLVGDLNLLAGKLTDAMYWYTEAISLFRTQQDSIWNAAALEGQSTVEMLQAWSLGDSLHTSLGGNTLADPWANIADKMGQAINLYSRAAPSTTSPSLPPESQLSALVLLYTQSILRYSRFLFAIWGAKGWNPLSLSTMLSPQLPASFSPEYGGPPSSSTLFRMFSLTSISRSHIASIASQAHGPFLMHLPVPDRISVLSALASLYSCLGFQRKEAYILREVQAAAMDLVVCAREEARGPDALNPTLAANETHAHLGVRRAENTQGNASVVRIARYISRAYGVNLECVALTNANSAGIMSSGSQDREAIPRSDESEVRYGWPEVQVGMVREALAIAEALPDHLAVAQISLSSLRALHSFITNQEQQHLLSSAMRGITISRRRGTYSTAEFWFDKPLLAIGVLPIPINKLPSEYPRTTLGERTSAGSSAAVSAPFMIYDPRGKKRIATQRLVQNESTEFVVTLRNPFLIDLDIHNIMLSTSGIQFHSQPTSVTLPPSSVHSIILSGIPLESGSLTIRGCRIQLPGGVLREFVFVLPDDSNPRNSNIPFSDSPYDPERIKYAGMDGNLLLSVRVNRPQSTKQLPPPKFLQFDVVPEQPLLRIRRSSLAQGSIMLYDGEMSEIRLTVENVSTLPIDFYQLSFDDSTIAPAQLALAEGELSIAEAYETEYNLARRPFLSWSTPNPLPVISPGHRSAIPVTCQGKVGCSQATAQISYAYAHRDINPSEAAPESFYARQITYPVNVTVYPTLECSNLDVTTLSVLSQSRSQAEGSSLLEVPNSNDFCLVSVDVSNIYGLPFEVTLDRKQEGIPPLSMTRTITPGSTCRLYLPIRRILLSEDRVSASMPNLSDRQFVVAKDKLAPQEHQLQRELFWYREALFDAVQARWIEPGTGRAGLLSLRSQQLTLPMRNVLRQVMFPLEVEFCLRQDVSGNVENIESGLEGSPTVLNRDGVWHVGLNDIVRLVVKARNAASTPKSLTLSLGTVAPTPSECVLFEGRQSNNFMGEIEPLGVQHVSKSIGVCFVSRGTFDLHVHVVEVKSNGLPLLRLDESTSSTTVRVIVN